MLNESMRCAIWWLMTAQKAQELGHNGHSFTYIERKLRISSRVLRNMLQNKCPLYVYDYLDYRVRICKLGNTDHNERRIIDLS